MRRGHRRIQERSKKKRKRERSGSQGHKSRYMYTGDEKQTQEMSEEEA